MQTLLQDVRHGLRHLTRDRGFAAAALLTVGLGVGGTATVFSVVHSVLLRPLPYPEPDRIVTVGEAHPGATTPFTGVLMTNHTYHAWERKDTIEELGAYSSMDATLTGMGTPQRVKGTGVTPSLMRVLGTSPVIGRPFRDEDAEPGAAPVVLLGHAFWQQRFGGDPSVLGRTVTLDERAYEIVGVMPEGFVFPGPQSIDIYAPLRVPLPEAGTNSINFVRALARLKPGVSPEQAAAEGTAAARAATDRPAMVANMLFGQGGPVEVRAERLHDSMTSKVRPALLVLGAGILLVLGIVCANVTNLILSRGAARGRELAVRAALGAGRGRLVRQLLTEALLIALAGGALGVLIGWTLVNLVPLYAPEGFPRLDGVRMDVRFLVVALLVSMFVGVAAGVLPALRGSSVALTPSLREGDDRSIGGRSRARIVLLAAEAALAVVLLIGASLLGRSFIALMNVDTGYDPENVLLATVYLSGAAGAEGRGVDAVTRVLDRVRAMPGVVAAGATSIAPFSSATAISGFSIPGRTTRDGQPLVARALSYKVTPGYAEALALRLRAGRLFRDGDLDARVRPVVVNESFIRTYLDGDESVVGTHFPGMLGEAGAEIIGIVEDVLPGPVDAKPEPQIYVPFEASESISEVTLAVKTASDPSALAPTLRSIVANVESSAAVDGIATLSARLSASVGQQRFAAAVLGAFASLALVLAATGLYGVLSYMVTQRRRELGVRAALGAGRGRLVSMVLRDGLVVTSAGLIVGVLGAVAGSRLLEGLLFGVTRLDAVSYVAGPALLLLVAVVACLVPALRAASVDPAEALRAE